MGFAVTGVSARGLPSGALPAGGGGAITVNNYASDRVDATPQRQLDGSMLIDNLDKGMASRGRRRQFARSLGTPLRGV